VVSGRHSAGHHTKEHAMTATTITTTNTDTTMTSRRAVWTTGLASGVVAAAANLAIAAAAKGLDHPLVTRDDEAIPLFGFPQMTLVGALLGIVIALVIRRRAGHPRRTFVRTAVVLTAVSCIPSVALAASVGVGVALVATHLVAAAIVIPAIASRIDV
jgi:hypothetical protein